MNTNRQYLENRVNTASQPQLHLMLIEGGIRFAREAAIKFEANDVDGASHPLRRAMDIASELLASVKHSQDEINVKLASIYEFVFTRFTMAYVNSDAAKLAEGIKILEVQQETWRMACEKAAGAVIEDTAAKESSPPIKGPHKPLSLPAADVLTSGGLSLEA